MPGRVAEDVVRGPGGPVTVRVDLHGVSVAGPDDARLVMRWEWMESITVGEGVVVAGGGRSLAVPPGAFGLPPEELAQRLRAATGIVQRSDVIAGLGAAAGGEG
ncbi:MAG TPA: hypothetical protein VM263_05600 [Acidimicrobiales bacterium]|nr:hypothetical protein [Acidimicrobiales bacterium]